MAARKQLWHPEEVKEKIKLSQLLNRLQDNALADVEFLTSGQINSINSLLDRVLPRLKAIEHSGTVETLPLSQATDAELEAIALARPQHEGKTIN